MKRIYMLASLLFLGLPVTALKADTNRQPHPFTVMVGYMNLTDPVNEKSEGISYKSSGRGCLALSYDVISKKGLTIGPELNYGFSQGEVSDGYDNGTIDYHLYGLMAQSRYYLSKEAGTGVFIKGGLGFSRLVAGDVKINGDTIGKDDASRTDFSWQLGLGYGVGKYFGQLTYQNGGVRGNTIYTLGVGGRF